MPKLISNWKQFYKMYSIWAFVLLGCSGDLYNLALQYHIINGAAVPALLTTFLNWSAFLGGAARLIDQKAIELKAKESS